MTDINITATTPPVITATLTTHDTITLSVSSPSTVSVTASVGNVGDMTKAVYDTDNDGIVDNSEALGGVASSGYVQAASTNYVDLTDGGLTSLHTHYSYYVLQTSGVAAANPADGSTYYFGGENNATTGANIRNIPFPFAGTIVYAAVVILVNTVLGDATQFSCYLRINNTTDLLITSTATATAAINKFSNTALSTAVSVNDYFEGKITYPTWPTTNPTGVKAYFVVGVRV